MAEPLLSPSDVDDLRGIIRTGSHSFYAASRLLPQEVRDGAFAIYAFCRLSDDIIDETHAGADGLASLRQRLNAAYAGTPADTVIDRCFARVAGFYGIPKTYPEALIEGLGWDVDERTYETLSDVYAYAARVAGTVGAMMAILMGARHPSAIARASDLGAAMQLTNIARDVGEDARNGRIYLPAVWLRAGGLRPNAWLARPTAEPAVRNATKRLLDEADRLYARGLSGLAYLPARCRPAISAAADIYREIGVVIAANDYDSVSKRAVVPGPRKLQLVAKALPSILLPGGEDASLALPENQFLVSALGTAGAPLHRQPAPKLGPGATMLDLLLTLKARERDRNYAGQTVGQEAAG